MWQDKDGKNGKKKVDQAVKKRAFISEKEENGKRGC